MGRDSSAVYPKGEIMHSLEVIRHMNSPKQVAKSRKLALAMNRPDTQKSRKMGPGRGKR